MMAKLIEIMKKYGFFISICQYHEQHHYYAVGAPCFKQPEIHHARTFPNMSHLLNSLNIPKVTLFKTQNDAQQFIDHIYSDNALIPAIFKVTLNQLRQPKFKLKIFSKEHKASYFDDARSTIVSSIPAIFVKPSKLTVLSVSVIIQQQILFERENTDSFINNASFCKFSQ